MSRTRRLGRLGGLAAIAAAATPFAWLRLLLVGHADDPMTVQAQLGVAMALALAAGFVLVSRLGLREVAVWDGGLMSYLLVAPLVVVLPGSALAAAAGRSFRTGIAACAWATVPGGLLVVVAWLAEAPRWYRQVGGLLLDGEGGVGMGANLGDAIWWTLVTLVLWALPLGVLGAAAGIRARRAHR